MATFRFTILANNYLTCYLGVEAVEKGRSQKTTVRYVKYFCCLLVKPIQISRSGAFLRSILADYYIVFYFEGFSTPSLALLVN